MITKNYIKMCEADEDLKWDDKSWKPKYGDYRPTQEELQEIVLPTLREKYNNSIPLRKIGREGNWVIDLFSSFLSEDRLFHSNDITELWFAFVMKEKYNKVWTGDKWVENKV